jgi:hypothetical protein
MVLAANSKRSCELLSEQERAGRLNTGDQNEVRLIQMVTVKIVWMIILLLDTKLNDEEAKTGAMADME